MTFTQSSRSTSSARYESRWRESHTRFFCERSERTWSLVPCEQEFHNEQPAQDRRSGASAASCAVGARCEFASANSGNGGFRTTSSRSISERMRSIVRLRRTLGVRYANSGSGNQHRTLRTQSVLISSVPSRSISERMRSIVRLRRTLGVRYANSGSGNQHRTLRTQSVLISSVPSRSMSERTRAS